MAKKKEIDTTRLTKTELQQLSKCAVDPFYFSSFLYVVHPKRGKVRFILYPYQMAVLYNFLINRFNIILKFRQAGITELIAAYCLWLAMFHPDKKINIISIKDSTAKKVLKKIKYMYKNLPPHLQTRIINGRTNEYGTVTEMEFANGSFIASIPTTEEAGRSEGLSLLVIDEAAIIRWASTIWGSAFPTLSTGGSAILNSTPYGVGNFYHSEWVSAVAGGKSSVFHPIRLRWDMHPERDEEWYNQMSLALGPRRTAQEIDGDFLTSGNNVFDPADIKALEDYMDEYTVLERKFSGQYLRYSEPDPDLNYFIGADVASGRAKDYSAFTCMDQYGEEHSVFKGKVPVDKYSKILGDEGKKFGWALLAPETNDIGLAVTTTLQNEGYPNLYYSRNLLEKKRKKGQKRKKREDRIGLADTPGWLTTSANRSVIIEELEEDIRRDGLICKDPFFCQEAYTFIYDTNNRPVALGKSTKKTSADSALDEDFSYTDDSILGKAITNHIRKGKHHNVVVAPQ